MSNKNFYGAMENTMNRNENVSITENGAIGYRSTGKSLLDLNFSVSSMRNMDEATIVEKFYDAWEENKELALRWLFFLRDVREGLGERRSFRVILRWLGLHHPTLTAKLICGNVDGESLIPFYGRWDDIFEVFSMFPVDVAGVVKNQIRSDLTNCANGKPISLLAKWMPSINTSSRKSVELANRLAVCMGYSPRTYRKNLSKLRKYIDVVERKMSNGDWDKINYETVPSKANLLYKNAFSRHDPERRAEFLEKLSRGEAKINASTSYPYEIYHKMKELIRYRNYEMDSQEIATLEAMWKSILDGVSLNKRIIVVADGSGSMESRISNSTEATAFDVANSLALYFANTLSGEFHGKFITFSEHPRLVNVGTYDTLVEQMHETFRHREVANTNIEAVFDLILQTSVENHLKADELPESVLIISDMEFDSCAESNSGMMMRNIRSSKTLFEHIEEKYDHYGYKLPRLVFWNVCSRTMTIPVKENDLGVALVSGFSVNNINMVLSGDMDPYLCLVNTLMNMRYDPVIDAVYDQLDD